MRRLVSKPILNSAQHFFSIRLSFVRSLTKLILGQSLLVLLAIVFRDIALVLITIFADLNIFQGIHKNNIFMAILFITVVLQAIIVQFGSKVFHVPASGLDGYQWLTCIAIGFGTLPVGVLVRLLPDFDINLNFLTCGRKKGNDLEEGAEEGNREDPMQEIKAAPTESKRLLWKKAINKTTMQIRVIKAFQEPSHPSRVASPGMPRATAGTPITFAPRVRRMSVTGANISNPDLLNQSGNSTHSFSVVNAIRGGRSTVSDFASIQIMDSNEARSRGAPK